MLIYTSCSQESNAQEAEDLAKTALMKKIDADLVIAHAENITIQRQKVHAYSFYHDEPVAIISRMQKEMNARSSEYRMLPTIDAIRYDFNHSAFQISFER